MINAFLQASSAGLSGEMRLMKNNVAMSSAASDNEGASHTIFGTVILELAAGDQVSPFDGNKGQLISKCPFGVKTSPKKPTKFFPGFLP